MWMFEHNFWVRILTIILLTFNKFHNLKSIFTEKRFYSQANKICQPKNTFAEVCEILPLPTCLDIYGLQCNSSSKCECLDSDYK